METKNYMGQNQKILNKWQKAFEMNGGDSNKFCWDGIMFKGKLEQEKGTNNWARNESEDHIENQLWFEAKPRILFLTKEQNIKDGDAWDLRIESYRNSDKELDVKYKFNRMLVYILYGLANTTSDITVKFDDITNKDALKLADEHPFARINCNKEGGKDSCPNTRLSDAMHIYGTYLLEQINNLDADVFVCCGSTYSGYHIDKKNLSLDFLNHNGYDFKYAGDKFNDIYYDKEKNKLAIDSFHISYPFRKDEDLYNQCVQTYYQFLRVHPNFLKLLRKQRVR